MEVVSMLLFAFDEIIQQNRAAKSVFSSSLFCSISSYYYEPYCQEEAAGGLPVDCTGPHVCRVARLCGDLDVSELLGIVLLAYRVSDLAAVRGLHGLS